MQARIENPALSVPGALEAFQGLGASAKSAGIPETTLYMVELRASQINGCSVCVDMHTRELEHSGESSERIHLVAAWREAPYFSDAERAALALTEAATRLADSPDSGLGRDLGRGRAPLQRAAACRPRDRDRDDQRVQPRERGQQAGDGQVGCPVRRSRRGSLSLAESIRVAVEAFGRRER